MDDLTTCSLTLGSSILFAFPFSMWINSASSVPCSYLSAYQQHVSCPRQALHFLFKFAFAARSSSSPERVVK
jgi:hypothetical protein